MFTTCFGRRSPWLVVVGVIAACGDDGSAATSTEDSSSGTSDDTTTASEGTDGSDSDPDDSGTGVDASSDTGFSPPEPMCGNGFVEVGEECDDANEQDDDACSNACQLPCGLEWSAAHLGPTQESDVYGLHVAVDADGGAVAIGFQREVTVDPKGNSTIGDPTALIVALDPEGVERWTRVLAQTDLSVQPGDVAVAADGSIYVAVSSELATGGRDVSVSKLAAEDGSTTWTHDVVAPVADGDDEADALVVTADGDVVVVATVRVADMNDDVWVRRIAGTDGAEVWTTTFDGMAVGEFSTDNGGPATVAADGSVFVLTQPYVDFSTTPVTLLAFGPDGGAPLWTWTPTQAGAVQEFFPVGVELGDDGSVYVGYERLTSQVEFWLAKLDADGNELWTVDRDHFIGDVGNDWRMGGLAYAADRGPIVVGGYETGRGDDGWSEAWVAQLDPEAEIRCATTHQATGGGVVPPTLFVNDGAVTTDGGPVLVGELFDSPESALWVARFRAY